MSCVIFSNKQVELLTPQPTLKLEYNPMLAASDCLFSILPATLHIWRPFTLSQLEDVPYSGDKGPLFQKYKKYVKTISM
jgi:hypothetical protein